MFTIATWNINSIKVRLPHILQWLAENPVDVLALQELKCTNEAFPVDDFKAVGYHAVFSGQKTYNGVATLSKKIASHPLTDLPNFEDPQRRLLAATIADKRVLNLYVPNGQSVDSDKYEYKLEWLAKVRDFISDEMKHFDQYIVLGDFNIAPESRDVHDPKAWEGQVLCSDKERLAFNELLSLGLSDAFRLFDQAEKIYSWWDYRQMAFRRNHGLRIDHILISPALTKQCSSCVIDKTPRKWERPSDHAPVIAHFS